MSDREKFEQWLVSTYPGAITTRCPDGYIGTVPHPVLRATYASVQMLWEAFRAGAQPAPQPAEQQPSVQKPVGFVSQDFLEGKWSLDHIAKSDEGQISRTIPVFAKPPQPAPDVAELVEALEELVDLMQGVIDGDYEPDSLTLQPATVALAAHRKQGGEK